MQRRYLLISTLTFITLLNGVANLLDAATPTTHAPHPWLHTFSPLEFLHFPRAVTLLLGVVLLVSAVNIYRRKARAWQLTVAWAGFAALWHAFKDQQPSATGCALVLLALLLYARPHFTVQSRQPDWRAALWRCGLALFAAISYGVAGFWLLEPQEFGQNFNWHASLKQTLLCLALLDTPSLVPQTRHAAWFLDSLQALTFVVLGYGLLALFRPMLYRWHTLPHERALAREILSKHGRAALDNFKLWPDKSYFFNRTRTCCIAYRVAANMAVALADPVGPAGQIPETVQAFKQYCEDNGWAVAWHQTLPDWLPDYRRAGFKTLKIGDDALVDLTSFSLTQPRFKRFRQRIGQLEKQGVQFRHYAAPLTPALLARLRNVSDEWLALPGKRERTFTLGQFAEDYLRNTSVFAAEDKDGQLLAFVNFLPSYYAGEATIDLMRHRPHAPNGIMDYLFMKLFLHCQQQGYTRFNLGMAPMAGFQERETASTAEKAVHAFFQRLNFLFSFRGIKQYKAKFADAWEPRYVVYRNVFELPQLGLALGQLTELKGIEPRWLRESNGGLREIGWRETSAAPEFGASLTLDERGVLSS